MNLISWLDSHSGSILSLLTGLYVGSSFFVVRAMGRANALAKELERSRVRPYVYLRVKIVDGYVHTAICNSGLSGAFRVRLALDPSLKSVVLGDQPSYLHEEIAFLAPQAALEDSLGHVKNLHKHYPSFRFHGSLTYCDSVGKSYTDPVSQDLSFLKLHSYIGTDRGPRGLELG